MLACICTAWSFKRTHYCRSKDLMVRLCLMILVGFLFQCLLISNVQGSCGSWLESKHHRGMKSGADFAKLPGRFDRYNPIPAVPDPLPTPCNGPSCRSSSDPFQGMAAAPAKLHSEKITSVAVSHRNGEENEEGFLAHLFDSTSRASKGYLRMIEHPPRAC